MNRLCRAAVAGLCLLPVSRAVVAQSVPVDAATRSTVVDSVTRLLVRHYIDADTARMIGDVLRESLRAGAYDAITNPAAFAEAVTRDLRQVNGDAATPAAPGR